LNLGVRYLILLRRVRVDVLAALRVQPNVHGPVVDDLDFVKVKVRVKAKVLLDDLVKVFVIEFDLAFYETFVLVVFNRKHFAHSIAPVVVQWWASVKDTDNRRGRGGGTFWERMFIFEPEQIAALDVK
jgi:hypothetical protein